MTEWIPYKLICVHVNGLHNVKAYHIMIGYVEDELAESIQTSTTVLHWPIQMNFYTSSWESTLHYMTTQYVHVRVLYIYLQAQLTKSCLDPLLSPWWLWQAPWLHFWFLPSIVAPVQTSRSRTITVDSYHIMLCVKGIEELQILPDMVSNCKLHVMCNFNNFQACVMIYGYMYTFYIQ